MKRGSLAIMMVFTLILGSSAGAEEARGPEKKQRYNRGNYAWGKACKDDVKSHCKDVQKGEGRIVDCLKAHRDGLTPACKEKMDKL